MRNRMRRALGVLAATSVLAGPVLAQDRDLPQDDLPVPEQGLAGEATDLQGIVERDPAAETSVGASDAMGGTADALRAALAGAGAVEALTEFYAVRGFAPYWTADPDRIGILSDALDAAAEHGLPAQRYDRAGLAPGPDAAEREVAAMTLYLAYAGDLGAGIVRPASVDPEISIAPQGPEAGAVLALLDGEDVEAALAALEPQTAEYRALIAERRRLVGLVGTDAWGAPVAEGPGLREGDAGPRVAALRDRLQRLGYGGAVAEGADAAVFDAGLTAAFTRFQADHGLIDDGVVGRRSLAALNASPAERLAQVTVNLERLRWLGGDLGARHIVVNIPDYSASLIENDAVLWHSRTVVGEVEETRTPEFSDVMTYFVVNPTWHVPDSIAIRTYLPKLQADPGLMQRANMQLFTRSGTEIDPSLIDFRQYTVESFPFRIKQRPSLDNALGRVKFMFPNDFAIYLHDTPARELFDRDARAFSNGCIRLEQPIELAHLLLDGQADDPVLRFAAWLDGGSERYVTLDAPVPVHLTYRTVFVDEGGAVRYRDDVYGRDAKVMRALEAAGVRLPAAQG